MLKNKTKTSWTRWYMPIMQTLGRRQKDQKFKAVLHYQKPGWASSRPLLPTSTEEKNCTPANPKPTSSWPTQKGLNGILVDFLSQVALGIFLSYWSFAYILWFLILWFYGFVCVSCTFSAFYLLICVYVVYKIKGKKNTYHDQWKFIQGWKLIKKNFF